MTKVLAITQIPEKIPKESMSPGDTRLSNVIEDRQNAAPVTYIKLKTLEKVRVSNTRRGLERRIKRIPVNH